LFLNFIIVGLLFSYLCTDNKGIKGFRYGYIGPVYAGVEVRPWLRLTM